MQIYLGQKSMSKILSYSSRFSFVLIESSVKVVLS